MNVIFFSLKQKKRARGGYGVRIEAGEGDRMGCFCQQSSGHRVHSALNMSCSGGADRDLQTGCRQEQREGRRSIRCDVLGPITMTGAKAPLPSLLNRTAPLFHLLLNKVSCVRGHPAHVD